eukprot:TRINITY_DN3829_c0_g1_i4.p1 TRINITY_DN3829_c0_g1~~TRINITY_DN3829_c0_g1_i4.p1  ORF type:complete len:307 (+),score=82.63 TRINITY_DN3829_c0_g1_i4:401-1321(+)
MKTCKVSSAWIGRITLEDNFQNLRQPLLPSNTHFDRVSVSVAGPTLHELEIEASEWSEGYELSFMPHVAGEHRIDVCIPMTSGITREYYNNVQFENVLSKEDGVNFQHSFNAFKTVMDKRFNSEVIPELDALGFAMRWSGLIHNTDRTGSTEFVIDTNNMAHFVLNDRELSSPSVDGMFDFAARLYIDEEVVIDSISEDVSILTDFKNYDDFFDKSGRLHGFAELNGDQLYNIRLEVFIIPSTRFDWTSITALDIENRSNDSKYDQSLSLWWTLPSKSSPEVIIDDSLSSDCTPLSNSPIVLECSD